jgi:integrase
MPQRLPEYCVEDRDRHGNIRIYFKKRGCRKIRLKGMPWTPDFMEQYEAAKRNAAPVKPKQDTAAPGTLKWLLEAYYGSAEFKGLEPRTQRVRRGILDKVAEKAGHLPFARLEAKNIRKWRDARAETPEAANGLVKALRQVFGWAVEAEEADRNPAKDVAYLKNGSQGHHSWTLEEVEQYEAAHPIGTSARLALALLLYTGQRRSDIVLFGKEHLKNGWLKFTQQKNKNRKPITLEIPVMPELRQILDASPLGQKAFLVTEFGKPFTSNGFGNRMRKWCDEAGLPHCSAHGPRKAAAARLAERGRSTREIMAVTGHTTSKEVDRYTRGAEQKRLAARALGVEPESHLASPTSEK